MIYAMHATKLAMGASTAVAPVVTTLGAGAVGAYEIKLPIIIDAPSRQISPAAVFATLLEA